MYCVKKQKEKHFLKPKKRNNHFIKKNLFSKNCQKKNSQNIKPAFLYQQKKLCIKKKFRVKKKQKKLG